MKFFIRTYGCQMNEHDSELLAGILTEAGYCQTLCETEADIIIVNGCSIRETAENKILGYIGNLKHAKEERGAIVVLAGCMAQRDGVAEAIFRRSPQVDIVVGTYHYYRLPELLQRVQQGEKHITDITGDTGDLPVLTPARRDNPFQAQINIIHGCNNFCTYCIVPYVRGREKSRPQEIIFQEAQAAVASGYQEVMLLGQNVNSYGKDLGNTDFASLLRRLHTIEGLKRIRYMTSHPKDFTFALADTIAELPKVCRHFHLPVQSGCDKTLQAMNRKYDTAHYEEIYSYLKEKFPEAAFTTDLIVGFPGETEEDFAATLDFVKRCQFDMAYTFLYSKRSGTPAATMLNQVPDDIKNQRLQRLMAIQDPISLQKNCRFVGQVLPVMVESISKNNPQAMTGRTEGGKPVAFAGTPEQIGQIISVKITEAKTWSLYGEQL